MAGSRAAALQHRPVALVCTRDTRSAYEAGAAEDVVLRDVFAPR